MEDCVKKLVIHQVANNLTDEAICSEVGISRKTLYSLKVETHTHFKATYNQIDTYLNKRENDI